MLRFIVCTECGNECEIKTEFDGSIVVNVDKEKAARLCQIVTHDKRPMLREVCPGSYMTFVLDVELEQQKLT